MKRERREEMRRHARRGKVWFHADGGCERRYKEGSVDLTPTPTEACMFFRDDPPTLEMYGYRGAFAQIFPSREQLESLRDFLTVYLETEGGDEG